MYFLIEIQFTIKLYTALLLVLFVTRKQITTLNLQTETVVQQCLTNTLSYFGHVFK